MNNTIRPSKLNKGDTIGIISPAGVVRDENLWNNAIEYIKSKGFNIKVSPNAKRQNDYLAGDDHQRLNDLMDFFKDEEINAIICSRGGYGSMRILNDIDYNVIKNNPKIFIGYSDITALHCAFNKKANLTTFHGPLFISDFAKNQINEYTEKTLFEILTNPYSHNYTNPHEYQCINEGQTEAELIGGNLAVITSLLGTKYFPDLENKILFLEDIAEPVYKIDRMLTQLKLSGNLDKISGLLFGEFTEITEPKEEIINLIKKETQNLKIPIGFGFPCGHGSSKATLPLGVKYYFNSADFKLEIIED